MNDADIIARHEIIKAAKDAAYKVYSDAVGRDTAVKNSRAYRARERELQKAIPRAQWDGKSFGGASRVMDREIEIMETLGREFNLPDTWALLKASNEAHDVYIAQYGQFTREEKDIVETYEKKKAWEESAREEARQRALKEEEARTKDVPGTWKAWNPQKRFGFIKTSFGDVFAHHNSLQRG